MGSKPSAPAPLDVTGIANQQNAQNTRNLQQQQSYNRPDQTNQYGSTLSWQQTGTDANGNPTFSQQQNLGAQGQQFAQGFAGLGQQYFGGANNLLAGSPDFSSNGAFDKAYDYATSTLNRTQQRDTDALDNKLKNQGLVPGTEAYDNGMRSLRDAQGDQKNSLISGIQGQMFNQGIQGDQQNINRLQSLTNPGVQYGGQTIAGGFQNASPLNIGNVDLTSLYGQQKNQQMQQYQSDLGSYDSMLGGLTKLGLGIGMAPMTGGTSLFGAGLSGLGGLFK